jgi:leader peptidase (prepilin peptidase) / N-methyltransferase
VNGSAWWMLGGAIAGLIAGSFIATLVIRWPQGRGLGGRSACDACDRTLEIRNLFPVASFVLQRGRCIGCGAAIDPRHVAIELTSGLIGALAMLVAPNLLGVAGALFGWQLLALAALDVEHYWLPDRLTALLAASGLAATFLLEHDQFVARLIGGVAGFGSLFVIAWLYQKIRRMAGMGAGDPKLLGSIGLWLGWQALPVVLVGASSLGLMTALLMCLRGQSVAADTRLPLGALMAIAAFPLWIWAQR